MQMLDPAHPGELLKEEVFSPAGLSVIRAAEILGVCRAALSAVLKGRAGLSPEMAIRVEKAFGISMDLLLKMQLQFDIARARRTASSIKVQRFRPSG